VCVTNFLINHTLDIVVLHFQNGIFVGPALSVPFMLLSVYGIGTGSKLIPTIIRLAMYFSYLRYALEGLVASLYGQGRPTLYCPSTEIYCQLREPKALLKEVGMEDINYWVDFAALLGFFFLFKVSYY
jgi:ATP-binding cassette subfamily G (WHITE) protein 1